jgi:hypothetical protein
MLSIALVLSMAAGSAVYAQAAPPMTNSDLVKLASSGLSDEFILNLIDQQGGGLSSDTSSLIDMKRQGVNEKLLGGVVRKSPSSEPLNSDSVVRLVKSGFSDDFIADLLGRQRAGLTIPASRVSELAREGVSERLLSMMVAQGGREIASGTEISIRLIDSIDSERDKAGDVFRASLEYPVSSGGDIVLPKGADVRVRLTQSKDSGKFTGKAELTVELVSVTVDGKTIPMETTSVTEYSNSQGASTAKKAAAVGAVGAIIGAIAGGGKGAAIGAGAGAAAGAGSGAVMKGQRVKIPSETLLTFTTEHSVKLP